MDISHLILFSYFVVFFISSGLDCFLAGVLILLQKFRQASTGRPGRPEQKYDRHRQAMECIGLIWAGQANEK